MPEATPENEPPLYLHAELLPNIRHITLYISLPATLQSKNLHPQITLSESRRAVSVCLPEPLGHVSDTIKLPARVNEAARRTLTSAPQQNSQTGAHTPEYSFRMQIDDAAEPLLSREETLDGFVPWTATDMRPSTRLRCRACENMILESSETDRPDTETIEGEREPKKGWTWKDLPSGNWAEMMDFWHCHKPDPVDDPSASGNLSQEQSAVVKGYGAANQVVAAAGTVLVDVATFLVAEGDCRGVKQAAENKPDTSPAELLCSNCDSLIGIDDPVAQGWRLFKTSLSAQSPPDESQPSDEVPPWKTHSIETVLAAQLLELIERESARRFVLHAGHKHGLLLWVFNPDLRYSNSGASHSITAQRAMKVLFQDVADVDEMLHPERGKPSPLSVEELRLPEAVFLAVEGVLRERNEMLPDSARRFREWSVSIMHRYERPGG